MSFLTNFFALLEKGFSLQQYIKFNKLQNTHLNLKPGQNFCIAIQKFKKWISMEEITKDLDYRDETFFYLLTSSVM